MSKSNLVSRRAAVSRRLFLESLEGRQMLAADLWGMDLDVNNDGVVSPLDALQVINILNHEGWGEMDSGAIAQGLYPDVTDDGRVTPLDALTVIHGINAGIPSLGSRDSDDFFGRHFWPDVNNDGRVTWRDLDAILQGFLDRGVGEHNPFDHPEVWLDPNFDGMRTHYDAVLVARYLRDYGETEWPLYPRAWLDATEADWLPEAVTAVSGEKNVVLGGFTAHVAANTPHAATDLLLTQVHVNVVQGDLRNVQNWSLWMDSNGDQVMDTILQQGVAASWDGQSVVFNRIAHGAGCIIAPGQEIRFEYRGDVVRNLLSDPATIQAGFRGMEVEKLETGEWTGWGIGWVDQPVVSLTRSGTLEASPGRFIPSQNLAIGTISPEILAFGLTMNDEAGGIHEIGLSITGESRGVDQFWLYLGDAQSPFATAGRIGPNEFWAPVYSPMPIEKGQMAVIRVRAAMMPSGYYPESGGDQFSIAIDRVMAVGFSSSDLIEGDILEPIVSAVHTVVDRR